MNRTTIQAVLGLSATVACALGFSALAQAGGGDNDNPYNMPRSLSAGSTGGGSGSSLSAGEEGVQKTTTESAPPQDEPNSGAMGSGQFKATKPPSLAPVTAVSVEPGGVFKFVNAMNVNHSSVELNGSQLATVLPVIRGGTGAQAPSAVKALAGSVVTAQNLTSSARIQGVCEIQAGSAHAIARLPSTRESSVAAVSVGTLGSNGTFAVDQVVMVPVTSAGLDVTALAAQWASVPNARGKSIKVEIGAGEPAILATITFPVGTPNPTFRVDTTPTAP